LFTKEEQHCVTPWGEGPLTMGDVVLGGI